MEPSSCVKYGIFFTTLRTVSFSRRTLLHRVIYSCYWTQHYAIVMGCNNANSCQLRQYVPLVGFTYRSNEPSCLIAGDILALPHNCNLLQELNYKGEYVVQAVGFLTSPIRG